MVSSTNIAIFISCLAFAGYRSYRTGFLCTLLDLCGTCCAYFASIYLAPGLADILRGFGVGFMLSYGCALVIIFITVVGVVTVLPRRLVPGLSEVSAKHKLGGLAVGIFIGLLFALVLTWLANLFQVISGVGQKAYEPDVLAEASARFVSKTAEAGMGALGLGAEQTRLASVLLREPQLVSLAAREVAESELLSELWSDGEFQFFMSQQDHDAMMKHDKFIHLVEQPSVKQLLDLTSARTSPNVPLTRNVAEKMSFLWLRMRALRSDERVVAILNDPEFKILLEKQNPWALLGNQKTRALMDIVFDVASDNDDDVVTPLAYQEKSIVQPSPQVIYKWKNDKGETQYTGFEQTPEDKRRTAEKIIE